MRRFLFFLLIVTVFATAGCPPSSSPPSGPPPPAPFTHILFAGGATGGTRSPVPTTHAEVYDIANRRFTAAPDMHSSRLQAAAVLLTKGPKSGMILITGGQAASGDYLKTAELFDFSGGSPGQFNNTASMSTTRLGHTATVLLSGDVLITGGLDQPGHATNSAEIFSANQPGFQQIAPMAHARVWHTATLLGDGRVLIVGGDGNGSAEIFDPTHNTFSSAGTMSVDRHNHTATLLPNGTVLIAGGLNFSTNSRVKTLEVWNSGAFSVQGSLQIARDTHTATWYAGTLLIAGGLVDPSPTATNIIELCDTIHFTCTVPRVTMTAPRADHSATLLGVGPDAGNVLLLGGHSAQSAVFDDAEIFNPAGNTFTASPPPVTARLLHVAVPFP